MACGWRGESGVGSVLVWGRGGVGGWGREHCKRVAWDLGRTAARGLGLYMSRVTLGEGGAEGGGKGGGPGPGAEPPGRRAGVVTVSLRKRGPCAATAGPAGDVGPRGPTAARRGCRWSCGIRGETSLAEVQGGGGGGGAARWIRSHRRVGPA